MTHPSTRRRFLATSAAWLGAAATGHAIAPPRQRRISLLHTTDLHGHIVPTKNYHGVGHLGGLARCTTRIRQWRRESPNSILLDIGDVYQGTPESFSNQGKLMMQLFNRIGYDAWVLGNHDFDWGPEALAANLALTKAAVLTANIEVSGKRPGDLSGAWGNVLPWTMKEVAGFRIALIGLVTPGLPYWLPQETLGPVKATDPIPVLQRAVNQAQSAHANAVILLTHMGWRASDDFANPLRKILGSVPGIDAALCGHSHKDKPHWDCNGVLCSQASYYGIHCGRLDLFFDLETRKLVRKHAVTDLMDKRYPLDPAVMDLARPALDRASQQLGRKVGHLKQVIKATGPDSELAQFFCRAFAAALKRNQTPVDGVFHGTFGTGDLHSGDVTVADCWKILPYENRLITAELSAAQLIEIVREARNQYFNDRTLWPFTLEFDDQGNPTRFEHRGKSVPSDARFTIAFNTYDAQSGGQRLMRLREIIQRPEANRHLTGVDTRSALIDHFLDHPKTN